MNLVSWFRCMALPQAWVEVKTQVHIKDLRCCSGVFPLMNVEPLSKHANLKRCDQSLVWLWAVCSPYGNNVLIKSGRALQVIYSQTQGDLQLHRLKHKNLMYLYLFSAIILLYFVFACKLSRQQLIMKTSAFQFK